uniref:Cytochrome b5 heme-binding domain-containing protein n=1 Tax=Panagrolaimus superbus TaxID=310955 RepID=A0A914YKI1_9BILA
MDFAGVLELGYFDILCIVLLFYVVYRLFFKAAPELPPPPKMAPPMKKQDMTVEELKKYNGIDDEHICLAVLGDIYDVTRGKNFYGPGSAYEPLAGHDATRALANMDVRMVKNEYDDISDLTAVDKDEAKNWADSFKFKYPIVGRLLAPGEKPKDYNDELASL